ncbi:DUF3810 domain-containing protein [Oscillospiraceae bacterium HV4-5-C5C]|nr:DUF3810 domain-containing protein [Oscillospiraceae bacterium HV4-5-C5C]
MRGEEVPAPGVGRSRKKAGYGLSAGRRQIRRLGLSFIPGLVWLGFLVLGYQLLSRHSDWAEVYSRYIRAWLIRPLVWLNSLLPFSLTELLLLPAALILLCLLLRLLFSWLAPAGRRVIRALRSLRALYILLIIAMSLYLLFHGYNFLRQPLSESLDLPVQAQSSQTLYDVCVLLEQHAAALREQLPEDQDGVFALDTSETQAQLFKRANLGYEAAAQTISILSGPTVLAKGVWLSHWWSYTGTTGMFMPLLAEANVNTDVQPDEELFTILHEMAHVHGIAREDEANFVAFLTGIDHPDPDFQYAAYLSALIHGSNSLYKYDKDLWQQLWEQIPDSLQRDIQARNVYWDQFEGPVQTQTQKTNDSFLKANRQESGIHSYGQMIDLVISYYQKQGVIDLG